MSERLDADAGCKFSRVGRIGELTGCCRCHPAKISIHAYILYESLLFSSTPMGSSTCRHRHPKRSSPCPSTGGRSVWSSPSRYAVHCKCLFDPESLTIRRTGSSLRYAMAIAIASILPLSLTTSRSSECPASIAPSARSTEGSTRPSMAGIQTSRWLPARRQVCHPLARR